MRINRTTAESFPLGIYSFSVHPPKVQNAEVRAVIRALAVGPQLPSGAAVRAALADRYGSRGGVARIYRLLAEERQRRTPIRPLVPAGSIEALQTEVLELREKLGRSELREEAHQERWAAEVDGLRLKIAALEPLAHQGRILTESYVLLRHQLQAAELRASRYEEELTALRQSMGQGGSPAGPKQQSIADPPQEQLVSDMFPT